MKMDSDTAEAATNFLPRPADLPDHAAYSGAAEPPLSPDLHHDLAAMRTLPDIARHHAKQRRDKEALLFEGRTQSYGEFDLSTNRVANALLAHGLGKGDRIAYVGKNSDLYFELMFGAAKAGVVLVSINWRLASEEIRFIIEDSGSLLVFSGPETLSTVLEATGDRQLIAMERADGGHPAFPAWRDAADDSDPDMVIGPDDVFLQLYTSGTTGFPKGVLITHENVLGIRRAQILSGRPWFDWTADDVCLVATPVGHIGGSGWGIIGLYAGAKNVIAREFSPDAILSQMEQHVVSKIFLVPSAMQIIIRDPRIKKVNFSRLRYILYSSSPIPLDLLRESMDAFGCGFIQSYGLTETAGGVTHLPPYDHDPSGNRKMRSAGIPMPGAEIAIIGEDGQFLPFDEVGEIVCRGSFATQGYWNRPDATADLFVGNGWLRTGDAGYLDTDGYLYLHDRIKDMIVSGGENIYPAEVENAIYGHPDVAEVAVIGIPDDKWGETVKAVVVARPGSSPTAEGIIAYAREKIAKFKCPRSVDFVDEIPKNPSGKILRRKIREPYWEGAARRIN